MKLRTRVGSVLLVCAGLILAIAGLRCGSDTPCEIGEPASVNVFMSVGGWQEAARLALDGGPVDLEDIESFLIAVDRITLKVSADSDSVGGIVIFDAAEQPTADNVIDLVDLTELSEIVSSAEVPPGDYAQIRLEISEPRLLLVGDPPGEYRTNVKLTANGRLFAQVDLALPAGETADVHLILDRIHLVEQGNGDFVLTPQLRVHLPEA